ncbi:MAG: GSCFA domain-containing protein [Bacteroidales bacterium]|nr:GSCFA domain-containing protein [Bacteroidales bacterium]
MKLQTPVTDQPCRAGISYDDKILMLGSCFSDNIGTQLRDLGFNVCVNPFGTLYNPASILSAVKRLASHTYFTEDDCIEIGAGDGRTCSFCHHTSFAKGSAAEFIGNANAKLDEACEFFRGCNKVIITLGTAWCYRHLERGHIVSNCLKRHPKEFERELLSVDETATALNEIMELCPGRDFIFTVSPIRHFKDGAHGNQISKSTLLLGINNVDADYFPSYEIVMDELRDYRFYAEDMCHPTLQTVNYIRERFLDWALPATEKDRLAENIRALKHSRHIVG